MNLRSVRARPAACFALAVAALGACGGRFDHTTAPASLLRIEVPTGATRELLNRVRSVAGVVQVAGLSLVDASAVMPDRTSPLRLAVADPAEVEPLAVSLAASLPASFREGSLLMSSGDRQQLGVAAGAIVKLREGKGPAHSVAVGDLIDQLAATGANAVIARDRVPWIEAGRPTLLLVAVAPGADPNVTATTLASKLQTQVNVAGKRPSFLTGRAASQLFGSFSYAINGDGTIRQDPNWVRRYIVRTRVPILKWVTCHRMMVPQLAGALTEVQRAGLASQIDLADFREAGGCYVARQMLWDPNLPVSMHAWGLAVDINVARNQFGASPTMHPRIVEIFERWGFAWGGRWKTPDGMHFELAALIRR